MLATDVRCATITISGLGLQPLSPSRRLGQLGRQGIDGDSYPLQAVEPSPQTANDHGRANWAHRQSRIPRLPCQQSPPGHQSAAWSSESPRWTGRRPWENTMAMVSRRARRSADFPHLRCGNERNPGGLGVSSARARTHRGQVLFAPGVLANFTHG